MFAVLFYVLMILFIVVSLFMILLVLIQKGRGGGLASAFGGMGGNTAFGSKTGDVLTWATSVVFGVFLLMAVVLNLMANTHHAQNAAVSGVSTPAPAQPAPAGGSGGQK
ncbi:MAG: preprotein translocase subunit SecG [Bacillota bacterium]